MEKFFEVLEPAYWVLNVALLLLAVCMRQARIPKFGWAIFGVVLIICAMLTVGMASGSKETHAPLSMILATITWGALGARFLGNWLTDRAT